MKNSLQHCPECGGTMVNGLSCFEQLGQIIAWEVFDSELQRVHFLTVASYNLQHPSKFNEQALNGLEAAFKNYLSGKSTIGQIRKNIRSKYNGSKSVLKPKDLQIIKLRTWTKTISDVYIPDQPQGAAERVKTWAETIKMEI